MERQTSLSTDKYQQTDKVFDSEIFDEKTCEEKQK